MKNTLIDVAKLASVSPKTVSRVMNNEPRVKEETKQRVWQAARLLNYQPSLCARQLKGAATSIGFIYDSLNSHYVVDFQRGILQTCHNNALELIIRPSNISSGETVREVLDMVKRSRLSGLVLTPPFSEMPSLLQELEQAEITFVKVVSSKQTPDDMSVSINDYQAAYDVAQHLIDLGHSDIAFLKGNNDHLSTEQRLLGVLSCFAANSMPEQRCQIMEGEYSFGSGRLRGNHLLSGENRPTAVIACNDEIAAGVLYAAQEQGISVPEELSVVGFEDSPISRQVWPNLTTANQNNVSVAQAATELLIAKIKKHSPPKERGFTPALITRESTTRPLEKCAEC